MSEQTYYQILNVSMAASAEQIRTSYLALAREGHPDLLEKGTDEWAAANERLTRINEAYNILKDSGRRARYDSSLTQGATNANRSKPTESTSGGRNGTSLTKDEQRIASRNKDRYRRALESNEMIAFAATIGLELYRQQAIRELQDDRVQTAKLLIQRFLTATS